MKPSIRTLCCRSCTNSWRGGAEEESDSGDHGIGEAYGANPDLPKCIAKGDDICSLRYHKIKK